MILNWTRSKGHYAFDPWKTIRDKNLGNRRVSKLKNTTDKLKDRQKNTGHY